MTIRVSDIIRGCVECNERVAGERASRENERVGMKAKIEWDCKNK